ncbi:hypothetical protein [Wenyingzhuangia aestuarii]|uniref:hypothetical protein n=1 Tax=Wenyingzhuangia aestuarii TaxID=1647582 RepID=UPI00143B3DDE|nr:hypothetical protein [Wenyingzhuangia aestuarii]NJB81650.1 hypothetical protein [Wenyingzhuangia aestuarii]
MKQAIKYINLIALVFLTLSCEKETGWEKENLELVPVYSAFDISSELDINPTFDVEQDPAIATDEEKFLKNEYDNRFVPYKLQLFKNKDLTIIFNTTSTASKFEVPYIEDTTDADVYDIKLTTEVTNPINKGGVTGTEMITNNYSLYFNRTAMSNAVTADVAIEGLMLNTIKVTTTTTVRNTTSSDTEGVVVETKYETPNVISLVTKTETSIDTETNKTTVTITKTIDETFKYKLLFVEKEIYN